MCNTTVMQYITTYKYSYVTLNSSILFLNAGFQSCSMSLVLSATVMIVYSHNTSEHELLMASLM